MILHIPHASTDTLGKPFLCDRETELSRMTDWYTDELFDHPKALRVVFPISRLICDVERFEDDALELMSQKGMGVCYTQNAYGEKLREIHDREREAIVADYYRPHHQRLEEAVRMELQQKAKALIVDCHSFPDGPLPCNIDQTVPRPDICIGTDAFHTPQKITDMLVEHFNECGCSVAINRPFAGTIVPMKYYQKESRVHSVMIEVNRRLYRGDDNEKSSSFEKVKKHLQRALKLLANVDTTTL